MMADRSDDHLFHGLKIDSLDWLSSISNRSRCGVCHKSRKYYCYSCCRPLDELKDRIPQVKLPLALHVIKHAQEVDGKSTAIHAAVLASPVHMYTYPHLPQLEHKERMLLVYPSDDAVSMGDLSLSCVCGDGTLTRNTACFLHNLSSVIVVDGTWSQVKKILDDPRLRGLRHVKLSDEVTTYWRDQGKRPPSYLATIEAIYYLYRQHDQLALGHTYQGQYDNLLFFYKHFYNLIHELYETDSLKAVKKRREYFGLQASAGDSGAAAAAAAAGAGN